MTGKNRIKAGAAALGIGIVCVCSILAAGKGGGENGSTEQTLTSSAYVPEFFSCSLSCENVGRICGNGEEFFAAGDVGEERQITQGEDDFSVYEFRTGIFRISSDGTSAKELEHYRPAWEGNSEDGNVSVANLAFDREGRLWVTEQVNRNQYELPEGFDETSGTKWDYLTGIESSYVFRQLDSTGKELKRIGTGDLAEKTGLDAINGVVLGQDGGIYVLGSTEVLVLNEDLERLFSLEDKKLQGEILPCSDGGAMVSSLDSEGNRVLKRIDRQEQKWGEEYVLPSNANMLYPGSGEYLFLYENGDSLYGRKVQEAEKLVSWSAMDINRDNVEAFCLQEDGRIAVLNRSEDSGLELILLTERELESLEEKTVLAYATLQLGYEDRVRIIRFNKQSEKYRVEIRDYSELNTESDPQAGLSRLNADIMAGNIPDILDMENLPMRQYVQKELLEDLWPFIEKDDELGRDALMERVLLAAETDGRLYRIFDSFSINTVAGARKTVGDAGSWSLKDLLAALDTMGGGCQIFGKNDTKQDILHRILTQNLESYIDWTSGECTFDSESFLSVLEFCDTFPLRRQEQPGEYESEFTRIAQGRQMLLELNVSDFDYVQLLEGLFQGEVTYVGYPMEDGKVGSSFGVGGGIAMTSRCRDKEGAWQFMREMLLPRSRGNEYFYPGLLPVNKEDFMAVVKQSMEKSYQLDENGQKVLDKDGQPIEVAKGGWMIDDMEIEIFALRQEQFNQIMELYDSIDTLSGSDSIVIQIVDEETEMFFHGDKTAEQVAEIIQNRVSLYVSEQM